MIQALIGLSAAVLLLMALHRADLVSRRRIRPADAFFALLVSGTGGAAATCFPAPHLFLEPAAGLVLLNVVRGAAGLLRRDAGALEHLRYVPVAAAHVFVGDFWVTLLVLLVLGFRTRNVRFVLLAMTRYAGPLRLSVTDVDQIVPERVTYVRPRTDSGITMVEIVVSMTLLATVSATVFTAAATRSVRVRQVRESAAAREAAVSELERLGAVDFAALAARDGEEFPVPGGGEPGRVAVAIVELALARIVVTAPRRSGAPIELATWRAEGAR